MTATVILLVLALVAFALAALGVAVPRLNLMALGLALWLLAELMGGKG